MAGRGMITEAIKAKAKELLDIEDLSTTELRLMPYIQHVMVNDQCISPKHINYGERSILSEWRKRGWIDGGAGGLAITKEFWDAINELIWMAYVAHGENNDG